MSDSTLLVTIAIGTVVVVGFTVGAFVFFSRFLDKEKEAAKRFREIHTTLPPDER